MIAQKTETDTTQDEMITPENRGYSFLVLKESEDIVDLNQALQVILNISNEVVDETDSVTLLETLLCGNKQADIEFVLASISKLSVIGYFTESDLFSGLSDEDKRIFWEINYRDHLEKFYYEDMLKNALSPMHMYMVSFDGSQLELGRLLKILKGQSTLNIATASHLTIRGGKGIRGMFDVFTQEISSEWVMGNIFDLGLQKYLLDEISGKSAPVVFYDLPGKMQSLIYRSLPVDYQVELVKHKIHSPDDIETVFDSLFYLLNGLLTVDECFDINEAAKINKTLGMSKLLSHLKI